MLRLVVVDRSAESRHRLVGELQCLLGSELPDLAFVPRVSVTPQALHELKFQAVPDVCVVGREIVEGAMGEIADLRRMMPHAVLLAELWCATPGIGLIEHLARYGVDDVLPPTFRASEFLQKLILLIRKRDVGKRGQLVVVGAGKGGLGVTSVAAAVAEITAHAGKRSALIDFDIETQDASRFLLARPFLNETLQGIFDRQKPLTHEVVEHCLVQLGDNSGRFRVMPPLVDGEALSDPQAGYSRILISLLEVLDEMFDVTVVDLGAARGAILEVFHRVADVAILVASSDPAALYPSVERARRIRANLGATARMIVVENRTTPGGLPTRFVQREVVRAGGQLDEEDGGISIPYCPRAAMWPGSGETLYRLGRGGVRRALEQLGREIIRGSAPVDSGEETMAAVLRRSFGKVGGVFARRRREPALRQPPKGLPLPPLGIGLSEVRSSPPSVVKSTTPLDPRGLISGFREQPECAS